MGLRVKGCCCMSLYTAGILHGLVGIVAMIYLIIKTTKQIMYYDPIVIRIQFGIYYEQASPTTLNEHYAYLIIYILDGLIEALLLAGIVFNNHKLLLPWVVLKGLGQMLMVPTLVVFLIVNPGQAKAVTLFIVAFIGVFIIVLSAWSWVVIYSFHHEIRNKMNEPLHTQMPLESIESGPIDSAQHYQKH